MSQLIFLQKSVFNYSLFVHNFIKVATVKKLITIKIQHIMYIMWFSIRYLLKFTELIPYYVDLTEGNEST